jgi:hypothetical protein
MVKHWREIVGDFEKELMGILNDWQNSSDYNGPGRNGDGWDEWAGIHMKTKQIRERIAAVLKECRENGWHSPLAKVGSLMGQTVQGLSFTRIGAQNSLYDEPPKTYRVDRIVKPEQKEDFAQESRYE